MLHDSLCPGNACNEESTVALLQDRKGQNPFPVGPFPSDGGRDENATATEYAR